MSAINHLKNFATSITGKLFTSSKKNQQANALLDNVKINAPQKDRVVRVITDKKSHRQNSRELSDFTIF
jgi:hypothetical protein